jgi:hypothetical protein
MGEHDNAGFPLSYCILSTATSLEIGKRKKALGRWVEALRDAYQIHPRFAHTDKDMGEIGMLCDVWDPKIQLCWWHLRKAVRERLAKAKLSTTPYNAQQAKDEFTFIDVGFMPRSRANPTEHEGGMQDTGGSPGVLSVLRDHSNLPGDGTRTNTHLTVRLPPKPCRENTQTTTHSPTGNSLSTLHTRIAKKGSTNDENANGAPHHVTKQARAEPRDEETNSIFCPAEFREAIVDMIEAHLCTHPSIPRVSHPSALGIREWAVREMYQYCIKNSLQEVWAYLWENWYRLGRWELWARSVYDEIPRLKTTMIMETQ